MDEGRASRATLRLVLAYGALSGVLIALLRVVQYQYLVIEHSVEIYGALVAALFAGLGIWLGLRITRKKPDVVVREVRVPIEAPATPFRVNEDKVRELGLTPRELEILGLIADGLSTREIAEKAYVSENTVKTHASRLFDKLGAKRRTQAVQIGKSAGLIP
jgi:NarL family two-component system response regulator LiaR